VGLGSGSGGILIACSDTDLLLIFLCYKGVDRLCLNVIVSHLHSINKLVVWPWRIT